MLKKTAIIGLIGIIHFGFCAAIVPIVMKIAAGGESGIQTPSLLFRTLALATEVLYFPIISLAVYSRHWFPGNWIYIPIGFNSLLWAIAIYTCLALYRHHK